MKKLTLVIFLAVLASPGLGWAKKCSKLFRQPLPVEQFNAVFEKITEKVKSADDLTDKEKSEFVRSRFFELEELARVYEAILKRRDAPKEDIETLGSLNNLFKVDLEDTLGKSFEHKEIAEKIRKFLPEAKDNRELADLMERAIPTIDAKSENDESVLLNTLKETQWLDNFSQRFDEINKELLSISWPKKKKIVKTFRKVILAQIKEISEALPKDPENPQEGELRPNVLEDGTHEMRRKIRRLSIQFQAMRYFVTYKEISPKKLSKIYADPKYLNSDLTKLIAEYENPIIIKRQLILALCHWIDLLGKAKDWGAIERELAYYVRETGIRTSHPAALKYVRDLLSTLPSYLDFRKVAKDVINEIQATNFFARLADEVAP